MRTRRTVITGIGLLSPFGHDLADFSASLKERRSGIRPITSFDPTGLPMTYGGEVPLFDAREYLDKKDRKSLKMMTRTMQFALVASVLAMRDAGLERGAGDPERFGVILGSAVIPNQLMDFGAAAQACYSATVEGDADAKVDLKRWGKEGLPLIPPMWLLGVIPNIMTSHVSILHDAQGISNTITLSDLAGLAALAEASDVIQRGSATVVLAGGADSRIDPITMTRHAMFEELSTHPEPTEACRPFDRNRSGGVMGEGAALFVLEEAERAQARGARIYGEILGHASGFGSKPFGEVVQRVSELALTRAGLEPTELDHVNAHGVGTRSDDLHEALGLEPLCRAGATVVALKGYLGNAGAASGALELAASLLALEEGVLPATRNCDDLDPECPIVVQKMPRTIRQSTFLKVSLSPLKQCFALVCRGGPCT